LKFLFHPGYNGGGFRVEDVRTHRYLVPNRQMTFTPAPGVLHEMTIHASRNPGTGGLVFDVIVTDGAEPKAKYTFRYQCTTKESGKLDRVGLERSGRRGGAALFDLLVIDLSGQERKEETH
jgi:hypothetical protein